jgi:hypothetical protein
MKITNQSFPHPVLGVRDDVDGIFNVAFSWSCDRAYYYLYPIFNLQNRTIDELIKNKKAVFVVEVECSNTFYRYSFFGYEKSPTIKIVAESLRDDVDVVFTVCSNTNLDEYLIEGAHSAYENQKFKIENGDIIAYGGNTSFIATKNYESLRAVSSIMLIKKGNYETGIAKVNFNEEKIELTLSKTEYKIYNDNKNDERLSTFFHSSLVFPILYRALFYIKISDEEFVSKKWFKVLKTRLDDENLSIEDEEKHFELIQKLFGNPITRFFEKINQLNEDLNGAIDE